MKNNNEQNNSEQFTYDIEPAVVTHIDPHRGLRKKEKAKISLSSWLGADSAPIMKKSVGYNYIEGINSMRPYLMQKYNLTDDEWTKIAKQATNIGSIETKFETGIINKIRDLVPDSTKIKYKQKNGDLAIVSKGVSNLKVKPEDFNLYKDAKVDTSNIDGNPYSSGQATVTSLANFAQNMPDKIHWNDGTEMSDVEKYGIAWNYGRIPSDYKNSKSLLWNDLSVNHAGLYRLATKLREINWDE